LEPPLTEEEVKEMQRQFFEEQERTRRAEEQRRKQVKDKYIIADTFGMTGAKYDKMFK